mmetsp:Transcript_11789/g.34042  ORF Transcript_11789/g.34042 Transcript_11789/m.34042 type:complete len:346 (-) Transcript_11789:277-1314(-)
MFLGRRAAKTVASAAASATGRVVARAGYVPCRLASNCLVVAEHNGSVVAPSSLATITAASQVGDVTVLVAGSGSPSAAQHASRVAGVKQVVALSDESLDKGLAENLSSAVIQAVQAAGYTHVLVPSTNFGKNYLPRLSAQLGVSPITDVVEIKDEATFVRPMYAGNALATVKSSQPLKVISVRTTAFDKAEEGSTEAPVEEIAVEGTNTGLSEFVSEAVSKSERPDLSSARVVVSGGRGMKNGENFAMLEELADKLGGAVGASRAAVDAGYVPNEYQVGQTGKVVAPDLYIAVGISGAIQHLSGMKDSKTIVAINKDAEAPIFQVADYGLVDDLFKAVPDLQSKI